SALTSSSSAARRSPTSSASSATSSPRPTACSSAAAWSSPSSPPRATPSGPPSSRRTRSRPSRATCATRRPTASRSSCPPTSSWRRSSRPTPPRPSSPPTRSPPTRWASTSAPSPAASSPRRSPTPRPSCGTARWASSSSTPSPPAPGPSPRRCRTPRPSPSPGAATPPPPCGSSASTSRSSTTSPPVVAPASSSSRARSFPASRFWETETMADRTPLMAGNWKMNLDHHEATHLVQKLAWELKDKQHDYSAVEVVVVPPFTDLRSVQTLVDGDKLEIRYGAQDVSAQEKGAYTGEISAAMLAKLGVTYAVVGHSERRQYHGEDDALVGAKAKAALAHGISPIICVGEGLDVRQAGDQVSYTLAQVDGAYAELDAEAAKQTVIAYEPVWAIGTGE